MIRSGAGPQTTSSNDLVLLELRKVRENGWSKLTVWAKPVGEGVYQIKGPVHLIAGFHFDDVVRAQTVSESPHPRVVEVIERSGYQTIHLAFDRFLAPSERAGILGRLTELGVSFEMLMELFYTLRVGPEADFNGICDHLKSLSSQNLIKFEPEVSLDEVLRFCCLQ